MGAGITVVRPLWIFPHGWKLFWELWVILDSSQVGTVSKKREDAQNLALRISRDGHLLKLWLNSFHFIRVFLEGKHLAGAQVSESSLSLGAPSSPLGSLWNRDVPRAPQTPFGRDSWGEN